MLLLDSLNIIDFISQPWHWAVSGAMLAFLVFLMTWMGRSFGISTTFRDMCSMMGAGKKHTFFDIDIKENAWRSFFAGGAVLGGLLAMHFLQSPNPVAISEATIQHLADWGISYSGNVHENAGYLPAMFNLGSLKAVILAIIGGFLVGFGARYAGGCTSGHAITGLSHFQLPSLLSVVGFFIGGLIMTWLIMPMIFG